MKTVSENRKPVEVDMKEIGSRLRAMRKHMELTQNQAAALAGTTAKHISEAERGVCGVSIRVLAALTGLYDVSADYILFGKVEQDQSPWITHAYNRLSPVKKRFFQEQTEFMLEKLNTMDDAETDRLSQAE